MNGSSLKSSGQMKYQDPRLRVFKQFGGTLLKQSNAKSARPISVKHAMHVVLSSSQASGEWSLRSSRNIKVVDRVVREQARRYGVRVVEFANMGNQLQLLIRIADRTSFLSFVRAVSGIISMRVTGAAKTRGLQDRFWNFRPWSRIVELKRALSLVRDELIQEHLVAIGFIASVPRDYQRYFKEAPV